MKLLRVNTLTKGMLSYAMTNLSIIAAFEGWSAEERHRADWLLRYLFTHTTLTLPSAANEAQETTVRKVFAYHCAKQWGIIPGRHLNGQRQVWFPLLLKQARRRIIDEQPLLSRRQSVV